MLTYIVKVEEREGAMSVVGFTDREHATKAEVEVGLRLVEAVTCMAYDMLEEAGNGEMGSAPDKETMERLQEAMFRRFSNRNN